jgi:minor extracellular serine protease Vpr
MNRIAVFLASAVMVAAQSIPNRYLVVFETEPAASASIGKGIRYSAADKDVQAVRTRIQTEHAQAEAAIGALGGAVTHRFDTVLNAMAVTMTPDAAARLRRTAGVKWVHPVSRQHVSLDHAVNVHQITQAWQTISGGQAGAGAGIKIAILDTGIDVTHPAFQGFSTSVPSGYPLVTNAAELANTDNKIIVSRFYTDDADGVSITTGTPCTSAFASEECGHATAVAMVAAGLPNGTGQAGISPLVGVAPGAWLGNYKVADDNGQSTDVTMIAGLEDAVKDGMDVANYSAGGPVINASDENGPAEAAIKTAVAAGTLFVTVAGNDGSLGQPAIGAIESPGVAADAITAGSNENERMFAFSASVGSLPPVIAIVPDALLGLVSGQLSGPVVDVTALDGNGYACDALPNGSLLNQIALIQRGPLGAACTFDTKLSNAQNAGAGGVIIYDDQKEALVDYTVDMNFNNSRFFPSITVTEVPMLFISQSDGQALQAAVDASPGIQGNLDFDGITPIPRPTNIVTDFASRGPTPGGNVKPDLLAVGDYLVTADATANNPSFPYIYASGTSFSAPMMTGSIALVKAARPGLSALQYKSLIINSAPELDQYTDGSIAAPQVAGAGILNVMNALQNELAASPTSLNFASPTVSSGGGTASARPADAAATSVVQAVNLTHVGSTSDSFTVTVTSLDNVAVPSVDTSAFSLDPGGSQKINVSLNTSGLAPGTYHGFLVIAGTQNQVLTRIPYWYAVLGSTVQTVNLLNVPLFDSTGDTTQIIFRCADAANMPLDPQNTPIVTTSNARARVVDVVPIGDIPGTFLADIVIGRADANGINTFVIAADGATQNIIVIIE